MRFAASLLWLTLPILAILCNLSRCPLTAGRVHRLLLKEVGFVTQKDWRPVLW